MSIILAKLVEVISDLAVMFGRRSHA